MGMRSVLRLEVIGDNFIQYLCSINRGQAPIPHIKKYVQVLKYGQEHFYPTVYKITGEKLTGIRDYTEAIGIGMRGIYLIFTLEPGIYRVHECIKLGRMRDYCIASGDGIYREIECPTNDI